MSCDIVEKIVIDQCSLHKLLNIVQPGSYDSVSKINFKALDKVIAHSARDRERVLIYAYNI